MFCTVAGRPILVRDDAAYLSAWIGDLDLLAREKGVWADSLQAARVFAELAAATAWYEERAAGSVVDAGGDMPGAPPLSCRSYPNPFSECTVIDLGVDATSAGRPQTLMECGIYDVSGRLVRRLSAIGIDAGSRRIEWDGRDGRGAPLPSGIYFARVGAGGRTYRLKMVLAR